MRAEKKHPPTQPPVDLILVSRRKSRPDVNEFRAPSGRIILKGLKAGSPTSLMQLSDHVFSGIHNGLASWIPRTETDQ